LEVHRVEEMLAMGLSRVAMKSVYLIATVVIYSSTKRG